ncbi:MAG TPA: hypothetical protein VGK67_03870 [Myxococcales bacterium]|jgi:hypothetical protein
MSRFSLVLFLAAAAAAGTACSSGGGGGPDASVAACPAPSGTGTSHGGDTIVADTTWSAADSPHEITFGFKVAKGATLTIEPCAKVVFKGGYGISVEGSLVARGTQSQPITFDSSVPATPWGNLIGYSGTIDLAYATLTNGGSTDAVGPEAVVEVRGDSSLPRQALLTVDHVTIDGSKQYGVSLKQGAVFSAGSQALTIKNAELGPVRTSPRLAGSIPAGAYTGNVVDEIVVVGDEDLSEDTTFHDRGVPYRLGDSRRNGKDLLIGTNHTPIQHAVLTVEAGVTIRVQTEGWIRTHSDSGASTGAIDARGTAEKPIVFTSAAPTPAAGDWVGLYFDAYDAADALDHVRVEYAGGWTGTKGYHCDDAGGNNEEDRGAVLVFSEPPSSFLTNSTLAHSAFFGVDRGWKGGEVDFAATNTFTDVAKCKQSRPLADQCAVASCQ